MAQYDTIASPEAKYEYAPHIDPSLKWAWKKERTSFEVLTSSIHIYDVRSTESLPFIIKDNTLIAVKIVYDKRIESMKII